MTFKQQVLKFLYPVFNKLSLMAGKSNKILKSTNMATTSFYDLGTTLNNGQDLNFESLKNKKVLIVNTASDCGYTNQYEGLQELHERYQDKLTIIGFPANDFGEQEKGSDATIEQFLQSELRCNFSAGKKVNRYQKGRSAPGLPVAHRRKPERLESYSSYLEFL